SRGPDVAVAFLQSLLAPRRVLELDVSDEFSGRRHVGGGSLRNESGAIHADGVKRRRPHGVGLLERRRLYECRRTENDAANQDAVEPIPGTGWVPGRQFPTSSNENLECKFDPLALLLFIFY